MFRKLKSIHLFLLSFLSFSLLPLQPSFTSSASAATVLSSFDEADAAMPVPAAAASPAPAPAATVSVYDSLHLDLGGLSREAFEYARKGLQQLAEDGKLNDTSIVSIADFSQPSHQKRLYVLDLKNYKMLFHTLVAHGRNSGLERATRFSNRPSSYQSSPGFYVTGETYQGGNGYSLKLSGLEKGVNDNAYNRAIVMHGAPYVSEAFANAQGRIGRSEGCPAVPEKLSRPIINTIKGGTCLFIYHPSYRSVLVKK